MEQLINKHMHLTEIGDHPVSDYVYQVESSYIDKDTRVLYINLVLNFVMPYMDVKRIKLDILNMIPDLEDVVFTFRYENMILTEEEIAINYLPYLIAKYKEYSSLTKSIQLRQLTVYKGVIRVPVLGEVMANMLNERAALKYAHTFNETFNINFKFEFVNNETVFEKVTKEIEEEHEEIKVKTRSKVIFGKEINMNPIEVEDVLPDGRPVAIKGEIFRITFTQTKRGSFIASILVTNHKSTIACKAFLQPDKKEQLEKNLSEGQTVLVSGNPQIDNFDNGATVIMMDNINQAESLPKRMETYQGEKKRVELHCHSLMSQMDGLNKPSDIVKKSYEWGQKAVAITDHGVVQAFPDMKAAADKYKDFKVIYGLEGYVFDDEGGSVSYKQTNTHHIIILAKTQEGLKNMYKLVSFSHLDYFYRKPRLPWSLLNEYREGLIIGSACEAGELYSAIRNKHSKERIEEIAARYDYLEIQPRINNKFMIERGIVSSITDLEDINRYIVNLGEKLGKPVVATTDAHYPEPEAAIYRNILFAGQGYKDAEDGEGLFLRTTQEMLDEFSYLGEEKAKEVVIDNTNLIADMIDGTIRPVPEEKCPPKIKDAEKILEESCYKKVHEIYGDPLPEPIQKRLDKELNSIIGNGYAVMYVSAKMLVEKSNKDGYLVGSRGSVGSSFAATMSGITEVNPLPPHYICPDCKELVWGDQNLYDCGCDMPEMKCPKCGATMKQDGFTIPFETFLGFTGNKEPDIDLNFAGEYQPIAHKYVGEIFGEKNVFKAGTVGTIKDKTAYGFVKKYFEERQIPVAKYEVDRLVSECTGVKRTTGQHPGGIVICPDDHEIYEFCPVQHPANDTTSDIITTHFDYHKIDQNLLKLDILGHDVPSMIRQLQDMTGIDPYSIPFKDDKVKSIFTGPEALDILDKKYIFTHGSFGIPEFGTSFTRQMLDDTKPDKFADLIRISGFSHGTDVWLNNAQDYIRSGEATMREVISTRDDIMNYLILKGLPNNIAFDIMEKVRKGKGVAEDKEKIMIENNVPNWYIDSCKKIKYMFPRAHAVAYTMMSWRMAWFKVYYPREFYATYFTTKVAEFNASACLKGKGAIKQRMDEITQKSINATKLEKDELIVLEVAYEMHARGYEFTAPKLGVSSATKFGLLDGKVILPLVALDGVGETAAKAIASEYEKAKFETVEEIQNRAGANKSCIEALRSYGVLDGLPETDQLSFF
ncbi:MAG: PolC-type DNA polymerase III [Clostridia bacterium]|nr:PolC-type DNA polymerase III [Clostridia bacterium]